MSARRRVLVIGPRALGEALAASLTLCEIVTVEGPPEGLWRAGREEWDAILVSTRLGQPISPLLCALRRAAPGARLAVSCPPRDEPLARQAVAQAAHAYVLEPLAADEVLRALGLRPDRSTP